MKRIALLVALTVGACAVADDFAPGPYTGQSGPTEFRIDDRPDGSFAVSVRQDVGRFFPSPGEMQEACRREAVAMALLEGRRRGVAVDVDQRAVRSAFGRNPVTSISSCTAQAIAVPVR